MRRYSHSALIGLSTLGIVVITGCGSTSLTNVWTDPNAQPALLGKLMVVNVARNPTERRVFEDRFALELRERGIRAEPSYGLVGDAKLDSSRASLEMHKAHCDGVFLTRILDEKTVKTYYPSTTSYSRHSRPPFYHSGWYGYYSNGYSYVTSPGYTVERQVVSMETSLYRVQDGALVWSAVSNTWLQPSETLGEETNSIIQQLVRAVAETAIVSRGKL